MKNKDLLFELYDVFNYYPYDEIEGLKNDEEFLQSVNKEIADEIKTVKYVSCNNYDIKTNFTNYDFMTVWETKNYWLANAGMGLGFEQYYKNRFTLQEAVDDQTLDNEDLYQDRGL